jgi:serine/threonine protein kinase
MTDLATFFQGHKFDEGVEKVRTTLRKIAEIFKNFHEQGFVVGTLKLASIFFKDDGDIGVLALPRAFQCTFPSSENTHKTTALPTSVRVAFGNDMIILGYILGSIATGNRPNIQSQRKLTGQTWVRQNTISFPETHKLPRDIKRLLAKCLSARPSTRADLKEVLEHPFIRNATPISVEAESRAASPFINDMEEATEADLEVPYMNKLADKAKVVKPHSSRKHTRQKTASKPKRVATKNSLRASSALAAHLALDTRTTYLPRSRTTTVAQPIVRLPSAPAMKEPLLALERQEASEAIPLSSLSSSLPNGVLALPIGSTPPLPSAT